VQQKQLEHALSLAAVVMAQRAAAGLVLLPVLQAQFDQMVASARQQRADKASTQAWAAGEAMSLERAVARAQAQATLLCCAEQDWGRPIGGDYKEGPFCVSGRIPQMWYAPEQNCDIDEISTFQ